MAETDPPKGDRTGRDYREGNNPDPGGEIDTGDRAVPPYDDRNRGKNERAEGPERMLSGQEAPEDTVQPESSAPIRSDAKMAPEGVGESVGRRGEDIRDKDGTEAGRHHEGTEGPAERPVGSSDDRDMSSTDPGGSSHSDE